MASKKRVDLRLPTITSRATQTGTAADDVFLN